MGIIFEFFEILDSGSRKDKAYITHVLQGKANN